MGGGKILVGTASWSDPGFVQFWYPPGLGASKRLEWYAEHFKLVEVNSTFYRVPEARAVARWCEQTPDDFVFDVKLHRILSWHSTKPEMLPPQIRPRAEVPKGRVHLTPRLTQAVFRHFLRGIEPLQECGKLGALLLQLSPEFSPRRHELAELDQVLEPLQGETVAVELRNRGWVEGDALAETKRFFAKRRISFVMVDGPDDPHFMVLPGIDLVTSPRLAYVRAHGRNASGYVRGRSVPARFDHVYAEPELKEISERAQAAGEKAQTVHVVFNNNKADYAPRAAAMFQEIVGVATPAPPEKPRRNHQRKLQYA